MAILAAGAILVGLSTLWKSHLIRRQAAGDEMPPLCSFRYWRAALRAVGSDLRSKLTFAQLHMVLEDLRLPSAWAEPATLKFVEQIAEHDVFSLQTSRSERKTEEEGAEHRCLLLFSKFPVRKFIPLW